MIKKIYLQIESVKNKDYHVGFIRKVAMLTIELPEEAEARLAP
jgi:hypothetical protein